METSNRLKKIQDHLHSSAESNESKEEIITEKLENGGLVILLNRPAALNALNQSMIEVLARGLRDVSPGRTRFVLLYSTRPRAFCAGGDVLTLARRPELAHGFFLPEYCVDFRISALARRLPVLALCPGVLMGGGFGLAGGATSLVATETTVFAMPEAGIGFVVDVGATHRLARLGRVGRYLALSGARLRCADLLALGLATHYLPERSIPSFVAAARGGGAEAALALCLPPPAAVEAAAELPKLPEHVLACFERADVAGVLDALARAGDAARPLLAALRAKCPLSLRVTWEALKRAEGGTLEGALRAELRAAVRMVHEGGEFREGVESVLVRKGRPPPRWKIGRVEDVPEELVQRMFRPFEDPSMEFSVDSEQ